jgi:formamidopyrimidine-DNA glycosylase
VETTRRGIAPLVEGRKVTAVVIREHRLRWPIPETLPLLLARRKLHRVERRAKYLLLRFRHGTLMIHLGMSGSLRVLPANRMAEKHDHFDLVLGDRCLRLRDPRRFGAVLWTQEDPFRHSLLERLGPAPLSAEFDGGHLYRLSRSRRTPVKPFIMDGRVVVGVGNIYASEALFQAGIHPSRPCGRIARIRYERLAQAVKAVLAAAIEAGGTTLQDFRQADGNPGYFAQALNVYGRTGDPAPTAAVPCDRK